MHREQHIDPQQQASRHSHTGQLPPPVHQPLQDSVAVALSNPLATSETNSDWVNLSTSQPPSGATAPPPDVPSTASMQGHVQSFSEDPLNPIFRSTSTSFRPDADQVVVVGSPPLKMTTSQSQSNSSLMSARVQNEEEDEEAPPMRTRERSSAAGTANPHSDCDKMSSSETSQPSSGATAPSSYSTPSMQRQLQSLSEDPPQHIPTPPQSQPNSSLARVRQQEEHDEEAPPLRTRERSSAGTAMPLHVSQGSSDGSVPVFLPSQHVAGGGPPQQAAHYVPDDVGESYHLPRGGSTGFAVVRGGPPLSARAQQSATSMGTPGGPNWTTALVKDTPRDGNMLSARLTAPSRTGSPQYSEVQHPKVPSAESLASTMNGSVAGSTTSVANANGTHQATHHASVSSDNFVTADATLATAPTDKLPSMPQPVPSLKPTVPPLRLEQNNNNLAVAGVRYSRDANEVVGAVVLRIAPTSTSSSSTYRRASYRPIYQHFFVSAVAKQWETLVKEIKNLTKQIGASYGAVIEIPYGGEQLHTSRSGYRFHSGHNPALSPRRRGEQAKRVELVPYSKLVKHDIQFIHCSTANGEITEIELQKHEQELRDHVNTMRCMHFLYSSRSSSSVGGEGAVSQPSFTFTIDRFDRQVETFFSVSKLREGEIAGLMDVQGNAPFPLKHVSRSGTLDPQVARAALEEAGRQWMNHLSTTDKAPRHAFFVKLPEDVAKTVPDPKVFPEFQLLPLDKTQFPVLVQATESFRQVQRLPPTAPEAAQAASAAAVPKMKLLPLNMLRINQAAWDDVGFACMMPSSVATRASNGIDATPVVLQCNVLSSMVTARHDKSWFCNPEVRERTNSLVKGVA